MTYAEKKKGLLNPFKPLYQLSFTDDKGEYQSEEYGTLGKLTNRMRKVLRSGNDNIIVSYKKVRR